MELSHYFESTSPSEAPPSHITVSFQQDPKGTLGAQLKNLDQGADSELFNPAYATVDRLIHGDTIARKCGVEVGDCIVAVNGEGFRRFAPDYDENGEIEELMTNLDGSVSISFDNDNDNDNANDSKNENDDENDDEKKESKETETLEKENSNHDSESLRHKLKYRVIPSGINGGEAYKALLSQIQKVKGANDPNNPLLLSLERYGWDSRVNAWPRFIKARNNNVPLAMKMIQEHEQWKQTAFPIDLRRPCLNIVFKSNAIAEIKLEGSISPPTIYVDLGRLMAFEGSMVKSIDIIDAFIIDMELALSNSMDCTNPKINHFIDLTGVDLKSFRTTLVREIHDIFEANYPETLHKLVIYPCTRAMRKTANTFLNFFNEGSKKKFVFTDDLAVVCESIGWYHPDVIDCGGVKEFVKKYKGANLVI